MIIFAAKFNLNRCLTGKIITKQMKLAIKNNSVLSVVEVALLYALIYGLCHMAGFQVSTPFSGSQNLGIPVNPWGLCGGIMVMIMAFYTVCCKAISFTFGYVLDWMGVVASVLVWMSSARDFVSTLVFICAVVMFIIDIARCIKSNES